MREDIKQKLEEMLEELEGKNITVNLIRGVREVKFIDHLHSDIVKDSIGVYYISYQAEEDINEYKWDILLESVVDIHKNNNEWLVFTNLGFDIIFSIRE